MQSCIVAKAGRSSDAIDTSWDVQTCGRHPGRVERLLGKQTKAIIECTLMSKESGAEFSQAFRCGEPFVIDAKSFGHILRRRLFWLRGDVSWPLGTTQKVLRDGLVQVFPPPGFGRQSDPKSCVSRPWVTIQQEEDFKFLCLTSSVPASGPRYNTVDVDKASPVAKQRWAADHYSAPPYQFEDRNLVIAPGGRNGAFSLTRKRS